MVLRPHCCPICNQFFTCFDRRKKHMMRHKAKYIGLKTVTVNQREKLHHFEYCQELLSLEAGIEIEMLPEESFRWDFQKSLERRGILAEPIPLPTRPSWPPLGPILSSSDGSLCLPQNFDEFGLVTKICNNEKLKEHVRIHTKEKPYVCEYCQKRFTQKGNLKDHIRIHTKEKLYQCEFCEKEFTRRQHLKHHIRTHTKEKPYQCEFCQKEFTLKGTLQDHIRMHMNDRPYQCDYCQKEFTRRGILKHHLRIHTKEKPYQCQYCQKEFSRKDTLKHHIMLHTNDRPYQCHYCQKSFVRRGILNTHIKTHTKEKSATGGE